MRKLFEICLKIQFFKLSCCFLRLEKNEFGQKGCRRGVLMFQEQTGKMGISSQLG